MPRRRIPRTSVPGRPDPRRQRGNTTGAQRRPGGVRRGQLETIAERRIRAFELRKRGCTYRQIAQDLHVDVHTIHGDIQAELASLRETAVGEATQLRALELERLDGMTSGLWPHVRAGSAPAVSAAVKVSERRARLLGLDAPVASRTEVSGSLSVEAQARYRAEAEELRWLDLHELEELAEQSQKMIDDAIARSRARRNETLVAVTPSTDSDVDVDPLASADQPAESGDG
jgi:hypothetical protein